MKFKKSDRLLTDFEFKEVFSFAHHPKNKKETIFNQGPYTIYIRKTNVVPRLGLSIGRKAVRRAHDRNRIKRCLREFFRLNQAKFSGDMVVKVQKAPESMKFDSLTEPLRMLVGL